MISISLLRVLRAASQNFWRNIWLSIATTLIMTITLLMMLMLYFANIFGNAVLHNIEQKVDLSVTFQPHITSEQMKTVSEAMKARQDVESVRVVGSDDALTLFRQRHKDDPFIEESLKELADNPLPASMYVVAKDPRMYQNIAAELSAEKYTPYIDKVNFENSRPVIDRLINAMGTIKSGGLVATIVFAVLAVLIMFNTVRLAIYSFREEIDIMRLVGASNWFIQGPFLFEAILVALLAVIVSTAIFYPLLKTISPQLQHFFFDAGNNDFELFAYASRHWITVVGIQAVLAVSLASLSSLIAIRRYLRN